MALEIRGFQILSQGEFSELTETMRADAEAPTGLVAWSSGEALSPRTLQTTLYECAPLVGDDRGHEILAIALRNVKAAVGQDEFDTDPLPGPDPGEI